MEVLDAILTRRSIRKFTGQTVSEEDMKTLLRAGFSAPTAHNKQPWEFVVVRDKDILEKIAEKHPYAKMLPQAGSCIIVCGDKEKEGMAGFLIEDCSAAIQNILLAAHGLGLGAVWCGLYPVPQLTKLVDNVLGLPPAVIPVGMVVVGHKAEERSSTDRYDEAKIHIDRW